MDVIKKTDDKEALMLHAYLLTKSKLMPDGKFMVYIKEICPVTQRLIENDYLLSEGGSRYSVEEIQWKYVDLGKNIKIPEHEYLTLQMNFSETEINSAINHIIENKEVSFTEKIGLRLLYLVLQEKA